jgi:hypothetical protein
MFVKNFVCKGFETNLFNKDKIFVEIFYFCQNLPKNRPFAPAITAPQQNPFCNTKKRP